MKSHRFVCAILPLVFFVSLAQGRDQPRFTIGGEMIHGGSLDLAKAGADTINLMASHDDPTNGPGEPTYFGDFEDSEGNPDWNGWTHYDITQPTETHWNVSTYNQPDPGNHAAWCGDITIASCGPDDPEGGYGNGWHDLLEFRQTVPYPGSSSTVTVTATLIHDSEPTYDYTFLSYKFHGQRLADIQSWDGTGVESVTGSISYLPQEYLDGTDIAVYFRFQSDGAYSDEDCLYQSAGGCQVDDINIHLVNGEFTGDFFEDFEHGGDPEDFGIWKVAFPDGVGDFARIWTGLHGDHDLSPCINNLSPQAAFIDDGIVVPGTGGSQCVNWCYGPGGFIVTTTGGLAGETEHINNVIESPVMAWPETSSGVDGISFEFGLYHHEDWSADSPGITYTWGVRSADTDNSAGNGFQIITEQGWMDRSFIPPQAQGYSRQSHNVTDLINPGRDQVQVQLGVMEVGYVWGYDGDDGYPAPYFDNATVKVFPYVGPGMSAGELSLAQDNFPQRGTIDFGNLGSHSVRFDMANNISLASHLRNDPGDSIVVNIVPVREGADFDGPIKLHYLLDPNPVFTSAMRSAGLPDRGFVEAMPAVGVSGQVQIGWWAFDLPDTGFLFPGDVLHYYIEATDAIGGAGGSDPQTALMPADTTGFSDGFDDPLGYSSTFTIHALPSIREDGFGSFEHPEILFINDFANRGGENKWYTALRNLGLYMGLQYDVYHVNAPSSGVGNGIGGRANGPLLAGYSEILYTCGNLGRYTISNGDYTSDAGDDVGVLADWLDLGEKDIFLTGDHLASDLAESGPATLAFLGDRMSVSVMTDNIRPSIGNQTSPLVTVIPFNPVFLPSSPLSSWYAFGGCPDMNNFDGAILFGTGQRLAEFEDPGGVGYSYSACTLNILNPGSSQSRVISMPVDLMNVATNPAAPPYPIPARALLLGDVLEFFGFISEYEPSGVQDLPNIMFATTHFPNPFNPVTTIKYSLPKASHLKLSIYNVRGQLVKTLIDGPRPAGADQSIIWDGTDNLGSPAASGIYFFEARAAGELLVGKMTLLK